MFKINTTPHIPTVGEIIEVGDVGTEKWNGNTTFPRFIKTKKVNDCDYCSRCTFYNIDCDVVTGRVDCHDYSLGIDLYFVECTKQGKELSH